MKSGIGEKIMRHLVLSAKKKAIRSELTVRNRAHARPKEGRFTDRDIDRIIAQVESNMLDLLPLMPRQKSLGNLRNVYAGLIDLALYRALLHEGTEKSYASELVADTMWRVVEDNWYFNLRKFIGRMNKFQSGDPLRKLGKKLKQVMRFPYNPPGYTIQLQRVDNVYHMDIYSCPVYDFFKKLGQEELDLFRHTWCTFDYAVAEKVFVQGGNYERQHTLSDGDEVCDMRWCIRN